MKKKRIVGTYTGTDAQSIVIGGVKFKKDIENEAFVTKDVYDTLVKAPWFTLNTGGGAQGPKGEKGETGPAGPKGEKGDTGSQGPAGPAVELKAEGTILKYKVTGTEEWKTICDLASIVSPDL